MFRMIPTRLLMLTAAASLASPLAVLSPSFAQDSMKAPNSSMSKDAMGPNSGMKHDTMAPHAMKKDSMQHGSMSKDTMAHGSMSKDAMSPDQPKN